MRGEYGIESSEEDLRQRMYREQAEVFKALSSPVRLCILNRLVEQGRMSVSQIVDCMCVSQSGVSQHLAKLRTLGIVSDERVENQVFYSCNREEIRNLLIFANHMHPESTRGGSDNAKSDNVQKNKKNKK